MARIADKHGLTNKYRPIGSGKRVVRRGRPRKYLFGAPSRKRRTYKTSTYKSSNFEGTNYCNSDINTGSCTTPIVIAFSLILLVMFSVIIIFRCLIPIVVGAALLFIVEGHCKKAWGLPSGRWSKPVSIAWTILTALAMIVGFVLILLVQIAEISPISIFIYILIYIGLSIVILRKKYNEIKIDSTNVGGRDTNSFSKTAFQSAKETSASEHAELAQSNIKIMRTTLDPDEFFKSYRKLIYHQRQVTLFWRSQGGDDEIEELMESLIDDKEDFVNEFIARCYNEGILAQIKDKILQHSADLTNANMQYITDLLREESKEAFSGDDTTKGGNLSLW